MSKILIIEDDKSVCEMIGDRLEHERYIVEFAHDGNDGWDRLICCQYDCVVLDWDLPGINGLDILKQLRERGMNTPVIMLTGKTHELEIEAGLDCGADDYLTKPFSARELSARLRALIRRDAGITTAVVARGDLVLDPKRAQISRGGIDIQLKPGEYALMELFMRNPGRLFSAEDLVNKAWDSTSDATENAVRIIIARLRQKIDVEGKPSLIVTVSKRGYKFEPEQM